VAVASNDVGVTRPARETVFVSHGSVLFVHASMSPYLVSHGWSSQ